MSFGTMTAWQALLLVGVAGVAAWLLFRIKVRPPRVQVPTLLLWRKVFDHAREMTWWERVRRAVSLAGTIVIAAALALAVTRPGPSRGPASQGRTLIVIDSSWSMAARTSSGETRWQRAVRQARALAAAAAGGDVALATTADGLVEAPTSDLALIETAIDRLGPSGGEDTAWPHVPGANQVHFITDGATERFLGKDVTVHSVYEAAPNVAIVAFGARPAASAGAPGGEAYVQVANYSSQTQNVRITVTRGATVLANNSVDMTAGEAVSQVVPLAAGGGARLIARIEAKQDALAEDNEAFAWIEGAEPIEVTVVSESPSPVTGMLNADARIRASFIRPAEYRDSREGVVVFDRWLPAEPPSRPALVIAPPATSWLGARGADEHAARWTATGLHPVLAGVDPLTVEVKKVAAYTGADLVPLARSERGTPLVSIVDRNDRRLVLWSFAVADTNLPNAPGFPVLAGNTLEWLGRPSYGVLRKPGPVRLPPSTTRVVSPAGEPVPLVRTSDAVVARLPQPGLYLVDAAGSRGVVGVNVGDPQVSNASRSSLADGSASQVGSGGAGRPWWMWAVAIGFMLVAAEWWTWQRRVTV
jgi:hypothetical protein